MSKKILTVLVAWMLTGSLSAQDEEPRILVADVGAAAVFAIDPATGQSRIILQNDQLQVPRSVVIDRDGTLLVADEMAGAVFRIDPETGKVVRAYSLRLEEPYGVAVAASGTILVTDGGPGTVVSIDPQSGVTTTVCPKMIFDNPRGIALTDDHQILVADYGSGRGDVVRFDPAACAPTPFGVDILQNPTGVALDASGKYLVSDTGANKIFSIDPRSDTTTVVSDSTDFEGLRLLTVETSGAILVADYVAGKVFQVDPATGEVTQKIKGWLRNPNGVVATGGIGPPPGDSSFTFADDTYTWKIAAADLAANDTPFDLAAFMNRLAFLSGQTCPTDDCQVEGLVPQLEAHWSEIEQRKATGATIAGKLDGQGRFQITSVTDF